MAVSLNPKQWSHDWKTVQSRMGWIATGMLLVSVGVGFWGFGQGFDPKSASKIVQAILLGVWVLAPPIWFWYEYFFLFCTYAPVAPATKPSFDEFKHGQDQSAKIWLALVTILFGLYFGKDLIRETPPPVPACPQVTCVCPQVPVSAPPAPTSASKTANHHSKTNR